LNLIWQIAPSSLRSGGNTKARKPLGISEDFARREQDPARNTTAEIEVITRAWGIVFGLVMDHPPPLDFVQPPAAGGLECSWPA
jgi:hypothetical protein